MIDTLSPPQSYRDDEFQRVDQARKELLETSDLIRLGEIQPSPALKESMSKKATILAEDPGTYPIEGERVLVNVAAALKDEELLKKANNYIENHFNGERVIEAEKKIAQYVFSVTGPDMAPSTAAIKAINGEVIQPPSDDHIGRLIEKHERIESARNKTGSFDLSESAPMSLDDLMKDD